MSIISWGCLSRFFKSFSISEVFLLDWQLLVLLLRCTSFHPLHLLSAMLIIIFYLLKSFWFYWFGTECIDIRIALNYWGITLAAIAAKIHNVSIVSDSKSRKFLGKIISKKLIHNFTDSDNPLNYQKNTSKESWDNSSLDFSKAFNSMKQILLAYDLLKETVTTIMMLNKNIKAMVCNILSTESGVIISLEKVWHAIERSFRNLIYPIKYNIISSKL